MNSNTLSNANNQSDILFTFSSSFKKKYTLELAYFFAPNGLLNSILFQL